MSRLAIALVSLSLAASPAAAGEISLWLSGTAFDGGPSFELLLGDQAIGEGTVDPIPTDPAGTRFDFNVSDDVLQSRAPLVIRFTNDKYEEGVGDRNLFILKGQVNGVELGSESFLVLEPDGRLGTSGQIFSGQEIAVAAPPGGIWMAGQPAVAAKPQCDASVTVTSFELNGAAPTIADLPDLTALLDQAKGECGVVVTGYSSKSGPAEWNKTLSQQRAAAVLALLVERGATFKSQEVVGFGPTDQFGRSETLNRRVVVQLVE
ncbi:MAG TPA: carbohydrate-binding domain-containing protein [Devosiaceae bacterium]